MENIIINVHEDNLSIFNEKLTDLNKKFAKKKTPYTLYVATLSSDFNRTNLSGVDATYIDPFDTLMEAMDSVEQSA